METSRTATYALVGTVAAVALAATAVAAAGRSSPTSVPLVGGAPTSQAAGITVTGTGIVQGTSDTLRLDLGVEVHEPTIAAAMAKANDAASSLHEALRTQGVADKDIRTSNLYVAPNTTPAGTVDGYRVSESVVASLRDLTKAGAAISAVVAAGGDSSRVNGLSLELESTGPLLAEARKHAVAQARAKAQEYAAASGRTLGPLLSITESSSTPAPMAAEAFTASRDSNAVPIAPGSQDVAVNVTVVYAFG